MELVVAQILTSVAIFASLCAFAYLPYCIIRCRTSERSKGKSRNRVPLLSWCNCFAAGVFMATCFLGMVPHVREHLAEWQASKASSMNISSKAASAGHNHSMKSVPWTEILLIGGFLMILLIEELMRLCQQNNCCSGRKNGNGNACPLVSAEDEPLMSDGDGLPQQQSPKTGVKNLFDSRHDRVSMQNLRNEDHHLESHGHHHHHHLPDDGGRGLSWRSFALLMGLGIHGVFEGLALGLQETTDSLLALLFGVMSHEVLCAAAFGINLAGRKSTAGVTFLTVVLFSLSIPTGMMFGLVVNRSKSQMAAGQLVRIVLEGLAAGTFVYAAFMDMLAHELAEGPPSAGGAQAVFRLVKVLCVCAGFALFMGFTFIA